MPTNAQLAIIASICLPIILLSGFLPKRMGYSDLSSFGVARDLVTPLNWILLVYLLFPKWPIHEELGLLRRQVNDKSTTERSESIVRKHSALTREIPSFYQASDSDVGMTNVQCFTGPGAAFEAGKNLRLREFTDGLSNTFMAALSPNTVTWTEPIDIAIEPGQPLPNWTTGRFSAVLMDGSVRMFAPGTDPEVIRQMITRSDGLPR